MKKLLAMTLAIIMVLSLCTFQVFADGEVYYLDLTKGASGLTANSIFTITGGSHKLNSTPFTFTTKTGPDGSQTITETKNAWELDKNASLTFIAPGNGTVYLYFSEFNSIYVKDANSSDVSYENNSNVVSFKTTAQQYTITKNKATDRLCYIEWIAAGPEVSTEGGLSDVTFNINGGTENLQPVTFDVVVSGYKDGEQSGKSFFAVSDNKSVVEKIEVTKQELTPTSAIASVDNDDDVNGTYTVTVTPQKSITTENTANIYIGVAPTESVPEDGSQPGGEITVMKTIHVTVTDVSERETALATEKLYMPIMGMVDVSNLGNDNSDKSLVFVTKIGDNYKVLTSDGNLKDFTGHHEDEKGEFLVVDSGNNAILTISDDFEVNGGLLRNGKIKGNNNNLSPDNLSGSNTNPFGSSGELSIIHKDGQFYLGNKYDAAEKKYLGYDGSSFVQLTAEQIKANPSNLLLFNIYIKAPKESTPVYYHNFNGSEITATQYKAKDFVPPVPNSVTIGEGAEGKTYTLLYWTKDNTNIDGSKNLLSGPEYVNIYQYNKSAKKYGLYGLDTKTSTDIDKQFATAIKYNVDSTNTNGKSPRANDFIEQDVDGVEKIDLYPVYVEAGHNQDVKVTGAGDTILTIKNTSENSTDPRWLGSITVKVYNDGNPVTPMEGTTNTMFFQHNSDNTVDIQLTLTDVSGKPITDGNSPYVINAVVAHQSGTSSDGGGLAHGSNYLTPTEARLDNVIGGSTVYVYMSTRYTAKYYLDGEDKTTSVLNSDTTNKEYSTSANLDKFNLTLAGNDPDGEAIDGAPAERTYIVADDLSGYSSTNYTQVQGATFLTKESSNKGGNYTGENGNTIEHGGNYLFGYLVKTYDHEFNIPALTFTGVTKNDLLYESWKLINNDKSTDVSAGNKFVINENIPYANNNGVFNFYAYTKGALTINKTVEGNNYTGGTVNFTVTPSGGITLNPSLDYGTGITVSDNTLSVPIKLTGKTGGVTINNLPVGTYTVTEEKGDNPLLAFKSIQVDNNAAKTDTPSAEVTIEKGETHTVSVVNTYTQPTGSLKVKKTISGGTDTTTAFSFTVNFYDIPTDGFTLTGVPTATITPSGTNSVNFTLKAGEEKTFGGIPVGVEYTVTETPATGYVSASTDATGVISKDQTNTASFTNYKTASLTVTKEVEHAYQEDKEDLSAKEFTINVEFGIPTGINSCTVSFSGKTQVLTSSNKTVQLKLRDNGSITISGLPVGTTYKVKEQLSEDDQLYFGVEYSKSDSGTIDADGETVTVTNTHNVIKEGTGVLRLTKVVQGKPSNLAPDAKFTFKVTYTEPNEDAYKDAYTAFINGNPEKQYQLSSGQTVVITDIPVGTGYTVEEVTPNPAPKSVIVMIGPADGRGEDSKVENEKASGKINGSQDVDNVTIYNMYTDDLIIEKVFDDGANIPDDAEVTFTLRFSGLTPADVQSDMRIEDATGVRTSDQLFGDFKDDDAVTITLTKAKPVATVFDVPLGLSHYEITETGIGMGSTVTHNVGSTNATPADTGASTGNQTFTEDTKYVTFKNTYTDKDWLTITKNVGGSAPTTAQEYTFEITRSEDNSVVGTVTVTGSGSKSVPLPAGTYNVTETTQGNNFTTKVNNEETKTAEVKVTADDTVNVTFTNIYDDTVPDPTPTPSTPSTGSLVITKTVAGDGADKDKEFTFTIKNSRGTTVRTLTLKDGGTRSVTLGSGDYTVTETAEDGYAASWTAGTDSGEGDTANVRVTIGGRTTVAFTNTFGEPTGDLVVTKTVAGEGADPEAEFTFTVTLDDDTIEGEYGDMIFEKGVAAFKLKSGGSASALGLPSGTGYTVVEGVSEGYTTTSEHASGEVPNGGKITASFVNTVTSGMDDPDNPGTTPDGPGTTPDGPGTTPDGPGTTPDGPGTTPDKPNSDPDNPKTGDESNLGLYTVLMTISCIGLVVLAFVFRRKRSRK